jgi:hypothetical protein
LICCVSVVNEQSVVIDPARKRYPRQLLVNCGQDQITKKPGIGISGRKMRQSFVRGATDPPAQFRDGGFSAGCACGPQDTVPRGVPEKPANIRVNNDASMFGLTIRDVTKPLKFDRIRRTRNGSTAITKDTWLEPGIRCIA